MARTITPSWLNRSMDAAAWFVPLPMLDAVVNIVTYVTNPDKPGLSIDEYGLGGGAKATKVDELTVDITTGAVDAIYPARAAKMPIPAPKWLATMPNDASITQAVGSGPFQLVEFVKGDHFQLQANEDYWGPNKPTIAEIKIVFRNEVAVRGSMLQAGEVQHRPQQRQQRLAAAVDHLDVLAQIAVDRPRAPLDQ